MEPQVLGPQRASPDPRRQGFFGHSRDLWRDAPAWRPLAVSTAALFAASVATALVAQRHDVPAPMVADEQAPQVAVGQPQAQSVPSPNDAACGYRGGGGTGGQGRVIGFLSRDQAASLLALTQSRVNAKINPDYVGNVRVVLSVPTGRHVTVLLPPGLTVKAGDRVAFVAGHRDWSMACGYVPNLIVGVLQPQ